MVARLGYLLMIFWVSKVVIKGLETNFRRVDGVSGATILGDGTVSLILDIGGLIEFAKKHQMRAVA